MENIKIRKNLELLSSLNKSVILRCPIIPDCNDNEAHYRAIADMANNMKNILEIHIEPYHPFGVGKYLSVGMTPKYDRGEMMDNEKAEAAAELIRFLTNTPVIIS